MSIPQVLYKLTNATLSNSALSSLSSLTFGTQRPESTIPQLEPPVRRALPSGALAFPSAVLGPSGYCHCVLQQATPEPENWRSVKLKVVIDHKNYLFTSKSRQIVTLNFLHLQLDFLQIVPHLNLWDKKFFQGRSQDPIFLNQIWLDFWNILVYFLKEKTMFKKICLWSYF